MSSFAQNAEKKWAVGLGAGAYLSPQQNFSGGLSTELYLSRYLSSSFDLRLKPTVGINLKAGEVPMDNMNLLLDLRYKFYNGKLLPVDNKLQPYLYAGAGYLSDNADDGFNFDAGVGTKFLLKPNVALFVEAGYIHGIDAFFRNEDRHDNFVKAVAGIEIAFGPSADKDKDGVVDKDDTCPDTPKNAVVDKKGCPIDTDQDGIYDGIDRCPEVAGIMANQGCPLEEGKVTWLKDIAVNPIFFETSSSEITEESKTRMEPLVKIMKDNPGYHVNVYGLADPRGDAEANRQLSLRRANAAVQYLISKNISPSRISSIALGEEHSSKANLSAEELQNSRRVEFNLYK